MSPCSWGLIRTQLVPMISGVWRFTIMLISHTCICFCYLCHLNFVLSSFLSLFFLFILQNKWRQTKWEQARYLYLDPTTARESAIITRILAETERQAEEQESFIAKQREGFRCVLIRGCWLGEAGGGLTRRGCSMWLVRGILCIGLSLAGPKLKN